MFYQLKKRKIVEDEVVPIIKLAKTCPNNLVFTHPQTDELAKYQVDDVIDKLQLSDLQLSKFLYYKERLYEFKVLDYSFNTMLPIRLKMGSGHFDYHEDREGGYARFNMIFSNKIWINIDGKYWIMFLKLWQQVKRQNAKRCEILLSKVLPLDIAKYIVTFPWMNMVEELDQICKMVRLQSVFIGDVSNKLNATDVAFYQVIADLCRQIDPTNAIRNEYPHNYNVDFSLVL